MEFLRIKYNPTFKCADQACKLDSDLYYILPCKHTVHRRCYAQSDEIVCPVCGPLEKARKHMYCVDCRDYGHKSETKFCPLMQKVDGGYLQQEQSTLRKDYQPEDCAQLKLRQPPPHISQ